MDKLTGLLVDAGVLGVVELKLTDKNKIIAAATYEYKAVHRYANDDDEWGEIRFYFSAGDPHPSGHPHIFLENGTQTVKMQFATIPQKI